jgi:5'-3' exonuclease
MPSVLPNIHPSYIQEEIQQKVAGSDENDERNSNFGSSNSGESEYEYVLDEAWQERFLESVRAGRIRGPSTQEETLKSSQQRRKENKKKSKKKQQAFLNKLAKKKTNQDLFLKEKQTKLATAMAKAAVKDRSLSLEKNIYSSSIDSEDSERTRRRIEYLETTLNMAFDQFCDTNHPDVWPS